MSKIRRHDAAVENDCIVGLDVGTTSVKAVAVDLDCDEIAAVRKSLTLHSPKPNHYVQDVLEIRETVFDVLKKTTMSLGGWKVRAVGVTGQSISPILLDSEAKPLYHAISHLDTRSVPTANSLAERFGPLSYFGFKFFANLLWVRSELPEVWKRIGMVFDVKEYVGYLLTNQRSTDRIWYLIEDVERLCRELGIPLEWLGPSKSFTEVLGCVTAEAGRKTGIPEGTPVVVSLGDSLASAFGSGVAKEGDMADVCGATEVMAAAVRDVRGIPSYPYLLPGLKIASHSPPIGLMHKTLVAMLGELTNTKDDYKTFEQMASEAEPGAGNIIFLPGSFKTRPKTIDMAFIHLGYSNNFKQVARAFYECTAFELRHTVEAFEAAGAKVNRIVVSGRAATPFWCQLKADVLGRDVETPKIMETGCLGAALTAGYAVGLYSSLEEAVSRVKVGRIYRSSGEHYYSDRYQQYLEARKICGEAL